jgi:hypothetical protein
MGDWAPQILQNSSICEIEREIILIDDKPSGLQQLDAAIAADRHGK